MQTQLYVHARTALRMYIAYTFVRFRYLLPARIKIERRYHYCNRTLPHCLLHMAHQEDISCNSSALHHYSSISAKRFANCVLDDMWYKRLILNKHAHL